MRPLSDEEFEYEKSRALISAFGEMHATTEDRLEALARLLEDTAKKIRAHRGGLVIHEVEDTSDDMFVGCRVLISGYMGG